MTKIMHMRGDVTGMFLLFLFCFLGAWQLIIAWKKLHGLSLTGYPDRRYVSFSIGAVIIVGACGWYFSRLNHFAYPDVEGTETFILLVVGLVVASAAQLVLSSLADFIFRRGMSGPVEVFPRNFASEEVSLEVGGIEVPASYWHPVDEGGGMPVLILHDYGASRSQVAGIGEYLAARGHGALAPDLDGHGANPAGINSPRMEGLLARSIGWLEERAGVTDGPRIAAVGVGYGGNLILHLAAEDHAVERAIAVDPLTREEGGSPCVNALRESKAMDTLAAFLRPGARYREGKKRISLARLLGILPPPGPLPAGKVEILGTTGTWLNSPQALREFASTYGLPAPVLFRGNHASMALHGDMLEAIEKALRME